MHKAGSEVKGIIEEYARILKTLGVNAERIILYGSFAKGTGRRGSDIDLVVVSNDFNKMNLRERLEILGIAAARIMKPIEARGYVPDELENVSKESFLKEILEAGIAI